MAKSQAALRESLERERRSIRAPHVEQSIDQLPIVSAILQRTNGGQAGGSVVLEVLKVLLDGGADRDE